MTGGGPGARRGALLGLAALALALVAGGWLRLWRVERDLPGELETTTAPAEDAFWYLESAQAPADGSGDDPLPAYDLPVWRTVARGWFAVAGTGIASSHALGATCGLLEVALLFLALRPLGARAAGLSALVLATSYPFVGLARTPLVYTPIATALTGIWALWTGASPGRAGLGRRVAAWALLALLVPGWKSVVLVLAPGLALGHLARREAPWPRARLALVVLGLAAVAGVLALVATHGPLAPAFEPTLERLSRYRDPEIVAAGARAPLVLLRRALLIPWDSGLLVLAPGLLGLAAVGALVAARARLAAEERAVLASATGWALGLAAVLATLRYQPLRWLALAAPALAALAGFGAARLLEAAEGGEPARRRGPASTPAGLALEVPVLVAVVANVLLLARALALGARERSTPAHVAGVVEAAGLGVALVTALRWRGALGPRSPRAVPRRAVGLAAVGVLLASGALDVARALARFGPAPTTMVAANEVARIALGPTAVAAGPYAPVILAGAHGRERRIGWDIGRGDRHGLEVVRRDRITHVVLEREQDRAGDFAGGFERQGERPVLVLALDVRGSPVLVYRLRDAAERGYALSQLERACDLQDAGDPGGLEALRAFVGTPELLVARARALLGTKRVQEGARTLGLLPAGDPGRGRIERGLDVALADMLEGSSDGGSRPR